MKRYNFDCCHGRGDNITLELFPRLNEVLFICMEDGNVSGVGLKINEIKEMIDILQNFIDNESEDLV